MPVWKSTKLFQSLLIFAYRPPDVAQNRSEQSDADVASAMDWHLRRTAIGMQEEMMTAAYSNTRKSITSQYLHQTTRRYRREMRHRLCREFQSLEADDRARYDSSLEKILLDFERKRDRLTEIPIEFLKRLPLRIA